MKIDFTFDQILYLSRMCDNRKSHLKRTLEDYQLDLAESNSPADNAWLSFEIEDLKSSISMTDSLLVLLGNALKSAASIPEQGVES